MSSLPQPRYALDGQVAIVTGAGRGIGRAIALRLAREGVAVTIADIDASNAAAVASELQAAGAASLAQPTDVTQRAQVDAMLAATLARFGQVDILVNNAGVGFVAPLLDTSEADWDAQMNVNAKGTLLCSQAVARAMIARARGGRIINNASGAGKIAPGAATPLGAYAASKHAVVGLTRQLGAELAQHRILVNCLCAGIVDTEMWALIDREVAALQGAPVGSVLRDAVAGIPLGRVQQPEDVANMVAFLASTDASYTTGQTFDVSGGLLPY